MIKLLSMDLNGTQVKQHTMGELIRRYIDETAYRIAKTAFDMQTNGTAGMGHTFCAIAGPLTKGLTLDDMCDFSLNKIEYLRGVQQATAELSDADVVLIDNSTGYMQTLWVKREVMGRDKKGEYRIKGLFGNLLQMGVNASKRDIVPEEELERLCIEYVQNPKVRGSAKYKEIKANGAVVLGIKDESAKPALTYRFRDQYYPEIRDTEIAHAGDTMGDGQAILAAAQKGGIGFAFNYNDALERFLRAQMRIDHSLTGRIKLIGKKGTNPDFMEIARTILGNSYERTA